MLESGDEEGRIHPRRNGAAAVAASLLVREGQVVGVLLWMVTGEPLYQTGIKSL